jgi:hypothetical protein
LLAGCGEIDLDPPNAPAEGGGGGERSAGAATDITAVGGRAASPVVLPKLKKDKELSMALSKVLRHSALDHGIAVSDNGYMPWDSVVVALPALKDYLGGADYSYSALFSLAANHPSGNHA